MTKRRPTLQDLLTIDLAGFICNNPIRTYDVYDYRILFDMRQLAERVRDIPADRFQVIAPTIMALKLMRTNWFLHACVAVMRWTIKLTDEQAWRYLGTEVPDLFANLQENLAQHVESGRDKTDKLSAAGLCKSEVGLLYALVYAEESTRNFSRMES